jgi:hypothetical protein
MFCDVYPDAAFSGYSEYIHNVCRVGDNEITLDPLGQTTYQEGEELLVSWNVTVADPPDPQMGDTARVYLSMDGGRSWLADPIWQGMVLDGGFAWPAEGMSSEECLIAVRVGLVGNSDYNVVGYSDIFEMVEFPSEAETDLEYAPPVMTMHILNNPSSRLVEILLELQRSGPVRLEVFDSAGRQAGRLLAGEMPAGQHLVKWDTRAANGRALPGGVYYMRLLTADAGLVRTAIVLP